MKAFKFILLIAFCLLIVHPAEAQFKNLLKKAANKVLQKDTINLLDNTNKTPNGNQKVSDENDSNSDKTDLNSNKNGSKSNVNGLNSNEPGSKSNENDSINKNTPDNNESNQARASKKNASSAAPVFTKTGRNINTVNVIYSVDMLSSAQKLLKEPVIQKGIKVAREKGIKGSDREILKQVLENPKLMSEIGGLLSKNQQDASALKKVLDEIRPAQTFSAFISSFQYYISKDFIRVELSGEPSLAKELFKGLGGAVTLVDIKAKKSYAISNYLHLVPAAVINDVSSFQDVFGMAEFYQKLLRQTSIKAKPLDARIFNNYRVKGAIVEIPVRQGSDKNGKPDDGLLYLHCLLSGNWKDFQNKNYDSRYKLFLEMYYTHDLDGVIPSSIAINKGQLGYDGFFVGFTLKDENEKQVSYSIFHLDSDTKIDEGMFKIPTGFPIMTQSELDIQIKKRLGMK